MKKILPALCLLILVFEGCKKNDDTTPVSNKGKIKTASYYSSIHPTPTTIEYTYDQQGRISLMQYNTGEKTIFEYTSGQITMSSYDAGAPAPTTVMITYLNASGLPVSDNYGTTYTYDSQNRLITSINGNDTITYLYTGNLVTGETHQENGTSYNFVKTYYSDSEISALPNGALFLQNGGKDLLKTYNYIYVNGTPVVETLTITYEFDPKGRISKETDTPQHGEINYTTFTYYE